MEEETFQWEFYDSGKSFPFTRLDSGVVQEMMVSLASSLGGTLGEFAVNWHKFQVHDQLACRLDLFSDAWKVASEANILHLFAALGEDPTYEEVAAMLVKHLDAVDITEKLLNRS